MIPGSIKFNIELFGEVAVNTIGDKVIDIIKDKISEIPEFFCSSDKSLSKT